jgi:hypothetical protein
MRCGDIEYGAMKISSLPGWVEEVREGADPTARGIPAKVGSNIGCFSDGNTWMTVFLSRGNTIIIADINHGD